MLCWTVIGSSSESSHEMSTTRSRSEPRDDSARSGWSALSVMNWCRVVEQQVGLADRLVQRLPQLLVLELVAVAVLVDLDPSEQCVALLRALHYGLEQCVHLVGGGQVAGQPLVVCLQVDDILLQFVERQRVEPLVNIGHLRQRLHRSASAHRLTVGLCSVLTVLSGRLPLHFPLCTLHWNY